MPNGSEKFLDRSVLVDIEVNEKGEIYSLGAAYRNEQFQTEPGKRVGRSELLAFDTFGSRAEFILGHNIIVHDIPKLKELDVHLEILQKPAVDTLFLSPLAFPANPYHRLVKDYKIVRDSINNPVKDALLAGRVFLEQWDALVAQFTAQSDAPVFYRSFLCTDPALQGTADALEAMNIAVLQGEDLTESFAWFVEKKGCSTAAIKLVEQLYDNPSPCSVLAYVAAWLTVAGGNSVLPPWVRRQFPEISGILHRLREVPCTDPACIYCIRHHSPKYFLQEYFGFDDFRPEPVAEDGGSLQGAVVRAASENKTVFATLPTGGGKSLCYLLPALMRYQRRNMLTVVISPLQALMKDQVDNFAAKTGTRIAAALYGLLTLPERGEVLEGVRLGDIGVLYVSPEQLRNHSFIQSIRQREIGAWVFDEAHCLSKWGHDFRPDYIYAIRFIREFAQKEGAAIPPVQCFTATAKKDVKAEITDTVQSELGLRVTQFEGGHERTNLHYEVYPVDKHEKYQVILDILRARYDGSGAVVIYCATKKNTEELAEFLGNNGYDADAFHAGLEGPLKKRILENFITGALPIICATNAFGMGIDKDNVRLVIHADIPGSLENYLQEAGRAGRDRKDADCILIFDEHDIEGQFRLSSSSRLTRKDIVEILRGIRYAARGGEEVVLTTGELLKQDVVDIEIDDFYDPDTKVRTAVAWLERAGFLKRNENNTRVFQGKPLVKDLQEAAEKIGRLELSARQRKRWLDILGELMARGRSEGFSTDELASLPSFATGDEETTSLTETQRVLTTLQGMADSGLLSKETTLSAYIRYKVANNAQIHLKKLITLEVEFLKLLEELEPDAELEQPLEVDLRQINQQLADRGHEYSSPTVLNNILHGLSRDGKGLAGKTGSLSLRARGNNRLTLYLHRGWEFLRKTVEIRQQASLLALQVLYGAVPSDAQPNGSLLVEFTLEQIVEGLKRDLLLFPLLKNPLAAAERALTFMHEQGVIDLQHGLAVFRQAMTLQLYKDTRGRRYTAADFAPLDTHYNEKNFQIHVMNEYAKQALDRLSTAMRFVSSYFNDEKEDFVRRFFPGRKKVIERATSEQSYQRIVDDLHNKEQVAIVSAPVDRNMLVLAGPGSGKTRVVVHRVAYLIRVKRVPPSSILVLCFNRSAIMELRQRLQDLVGDEVRPVTTMTFHGMALRLTGRSLVGAGRPEDQNRDIDFSKVLRCAVDLLRGDVEVLGFEGRSAREDLLGRYTHILVDEYQDIDEDQYQLVSLITGKGLEDYDQKIAIMAVGDDDQNIYRFRGANVGFIRRFKEDYDADVRHLIENYRSSANIIEACNQLIAHNRDRMKTDHAIRINEARRMLPRGGNWQVHDNITKGKVQVLTVKDSRYQSVCLLEELRRLQSFGGGVDLNRCAVLAREWKDLSLVRSVFEEAGVPINFHWGRGDGFPTLARIRENAALLDWLRERRSGRVKGSDLLGLLPSDAQKDNVWEQNMRALLQAWIGETHDWEQPVSAVEEYLYEAFAEQRRSGCLGNGVFLSTVHSVKGLEFDHVFVLGDSWQEKAGDELEEERRLYYVAMSRARETLTAFALAGRENIYVQCLAGDFVVKRTMGEEVSCESCGGNGYELLGLKDVFIDYAGSRRVESKERLAVERLDAGEKIRLEMQNGGIELKNEDGTTVGRLSKVAQKKWSGRMNQIKRAEIVALAVRYPTDIADEELRKRYHGSSWLVPIVEVRMQRYENG